MDSPQLPENMYGIAIKQTAKAREVFARCIAEINSMDSPDDREMLRLNDTARKLNRLATYSWESEERRGHAWSLMNNLIDAERAAMKWLKIDFLRTELPTMALCVLQYRRGGSTLCSNDFKAAWAILCRTAPQMKCASEILGRCLTEGADDADDSDYVSESEDDDMSVDDSQEEESSESESEIDLDEQLVVLGPDSETESDGETEGTMKGVGVSPMDDGNKEMAENVSLVANALLESVAPPEVFNQLQMAFKLVSLQGGCCKNNPFGENTDIISHLAAFVDAKDFLFFASVCKRWKNAWGERPTHTMALTPATSVSQLSYSFECGLGRTTAVCDTCIAMGRLDLLRCAMANNCPWLGDVCRLAAETGDLETLQWARTRNYPWGPETCALLAKGGHLSALKWCRQHGCPWDKETLQEAEWGDQDDVVEWAVANGCPDWSDGED